MTQFQEQELDFSTLWQRLKLALPWILICALAFAAVAYFWSSSRPTVYQAQATLLVTGGSTQAADNVLGEALVKAPPLPEGAVAQALHSTSVIEPLANDILQSHKIPEDEKKRLVDSLHEELARRDMQTVSLISRLDLYGNGIYTISGSARTPQAAQVLTNLTAQALLNWDRDRALSSVRQAQAGFEAQLQQIERELDGLDSNGSERTVLTSRQQALQESLTRVSILEQSISGVLQPLSEAIIPLEPVEPKPLRTAFLAGFLSILLGIGLAGLSALTDRRVRDEEDLFDVGYPTLATLPRLSQRDILLKGMVQAARQAGLYEAIGFLRVNLLSALQTISHPVIMVTSSAPGEGKSSVTAMLADALAMSGKKILIVDADLRRGTQQQVWQKSSDASGEIPTEILLGTGAAKTTIEALSEPHNVSFIKISDSVHLLPAGKGLQDSLGVLSGGRFINSINLWRKNYDVVLVDSAPLLAIADGLEIGKFLDLVIIVAESNKTDINSVKKSVKRAQMAGLNILGFVINKQNKRDQVNYSYSYHPRN